MSGPAAAGTTPAAEHDATVLPRPEATALSDRHRQIVAAATRAPSVHKTQPWRFTADDGGLDLFADYARQLPVLDPQGRALHLSCGAALLHAQVAARALGLNADPQLLPDPADPDHLARLALTPGPDPSSSDLALAEAIGQRYTYRDAFVEQPLPDALLERLRLVAEGQGARLRALTDPGELLELEVLLSRADAVEEADPAYRKELAASIGTEPADDGIPAAALPADAERGSSLRLRDFALSAAPTGDAPPPHAHSHGGQPPVAERPDVVVIVSADDTPLSWLRAGQALGAVLLQAAQEGVMAQPLAQVTDFPTFRLRLGKALGLLGTPQLALRLGYPTDTAGGTAGTGTPRRSLADVLSPASREHADG